jgi:ABC-type uncharacterized transport system permease subunit
MSPPTLQTKLRRACTLSMASKGFVFNSKVGILNIFHFVYIENIY